MKTRGLSAAGAAILGLLGPGVAHAGCDDGDGDGVWPEGCADPFDCDDTDPTIFPGAPEACDGLDTDCDELDDAEDLDVDAVAGPTLTGAETVFANWPDGGSLDGVIPLTGASGPVSDVNVMLWLLPDFQPHTVVTLQSPDGTVVELIPDGTGDFGGDFQNTTLDDEAATELVDGEGDFTLTYRPSGSLSDFDGETANGDWILTVEDTVLNFSGGLFNDWSLEVATLQPNDSDGDGFVDSCGDCDPADPATYPGALEVCDDGVDQDCDGSDTDGDFDGDGFPDDSDGDGVDYCGDCDDDDPDRFPGNPDVCDDGVDQDCDGADVPSDGDGDGAIAIACGGDDCDDTDPAASPAIDADGDGVDSCLDCDDGQALNFPGGVEECDGLDNDCDGATDEDDDEDGSPVCLDCDDTDPTVHPGAEEVCDDGVDQDCDDADLVADTDEDGFASLVCGGDDCDDGSAEFFPGAVEICDGLDRNCDGKSEEVDSDSDFHFDIACGGDDCDDDDQGVHPSSIEICNETDDDCDGDVDEDLECGDDDDATDDDDIGDDDDTSEPPPSNCAACNSDIGSGRGGSGFAAVGALLWLSRRRRDGAKG